MHYKERGIGSLIADKDILNHYQILTDLKKDSSVLLVIDSKSGELRVMKYKRDYNLQVMSRLKKCPVPGIPRLYEIEEERGHILIIEEYIHGMTLKEAMEREGLFSEEKAVECLLSLCTILKNLHEMNPPIIHRDIKPENIMITNEGAIRLVDFNGSKEVSENKPRDTVLFGTHQYAAPEQYGFGSSDCRTDIYQLGITMNRLLTGFFPVDSLYEGRLGSVIQKCIRYDVEERYQTIGELEQALAGPEQSRSVFSFISPVFGSPIPWKIILASCFYAVVLSPCLYLGVYEETTSLISGFHFTIRKIGSFFILVLPVFMACDCQVIHKYFPHWARAGRIRSVILAYMAFFVLIIALILLSDIISSQSR